MPTPKELKSKLWSALKSGMTVMLGLDNERGGHSRPMTAQMDGESGPLWFFTSKDTALVS
ncbi:MAG: pyridoxamine 5'-phosphate oxidase family protein, partial [Aestuariivirga sp.]